MNFLHTSSEQPNPEEMHRPYARSTPAGSGWSRVFSRGDFSLAVKSDGGYAAQHWAMSTASPVLLSPPLHWSHSFGSSHASVEIRSGELLI